MIGTPWDGRLAPRVLHDSRTLTQLPVCLALQLTCSVAAKGWSQNLCMPTMMMQPGDYRVCGGVMIGMCMYMRRHVMLAARHIYVCLDLSKKVMMGLHTRR